MERAFRSGVYPYFGAARIFDYIDDFIFDGTYLLVAEDGSVVTSDGRPVLQYVKGKFWANNHTHVLQGDRISTEYLYLLLASIKVTGYVTGAAQPKITQANLNRIPCPVPTSQIALAFDEIVKPILAQVTNVASQIGILGSTRDLLLPRLISGEIDVAELNIVLPEAAA